MSIIRESARKYYYGIYTGGVKCKISASYGLVKRGLLDDRDVDKD